MKDLQELFESLGTDQFNKLADLVDKKNINPKNTKKVLDMISIVYCAEMGVQEATLTTKELDKVLNDFYFSVSLYKNVIDGTMEILSGRMKLTNGDDCRLRLTPKGTKHAKKLIKDMVAEK